MGGLVKYKVDPDIAADVSNRFTKRRYGRDGKGLSDEEQAVLRFALQFLNQSMPRSPESWTTSYIRSIGEMFRLAQHDYKNNNIGSWSFAGFIVLVDLGVSISDRDCPNFAARIHYKSLITTAAMLPSGGTIESLNALLIKYLIKNELGSAIARPLSSLKEQYEQLIEEARESACINEWLERLADAFPLSDSQYMIYRCIVQLTSQGHLTDQELAKCDLDLQVCKDEEKRLDEISAYTYSPGISRYKDNPETACLSYLSQIAEEAQKMGKRAAKRQTRDDFARLMIPRFLMNDACRALDE